MKQFAPLLINLYDRNVLIVGGGKAALLKIKGISRFTSRITILSPDILDELEKYPFIFCKQEYKEGAVDNFFIVYACTDNTVLNQMIGQECERKNILYSICDNPEISSFVSPAIYKNDGITISVGTNGRSPKQAIYIRNQIQKLIEEGILKIDNI